MSDLKIEMTPVKSSIISKAGYDKATKTMRVEFKRTGNYDYLDVPEEVYNGFRGAESCGNYLNEFIKGVYRFEKILPEKSPNQQEK